MSLSGDQVKHVGIVRMHHPRVFAFIFDGKFVLDNISVLPDAPLRLVSNDAGAIKIILLLLLLLISLVLSLLCQAKSKRA